MTTPTHNQLYICNHCITYFPHVQGGIHRCEQKHSDHYGHVLVATHPACGYLIIPDKTLRALHNPSLQGDRDD